MSNVKKRAGNNCLKTLTIVLLCYMALAAVFYWASGEQLYFHNSTTKPINAQECAAVMEDGTSVSFTVKPESEYLDRISLLVGTYGRDNQGELVMHVRNEAGEILAESVLETAGLQDYVYQAFSFDSGIANVKDTTLTVEITAQNVPEQQGVSLWYGTSIEAGKFEIQDMNGNVFSVNGEEKDGKVCYSMDVRDVLWIGEWYFVITTVLGLLIGGYVVWNYHCMKVGRATLYTKAAEEYKRYSFLVKQLVSRDFRRKYKRSVLGVFWSFLNPLLTMMVQYFVFSTIFKSSIDNFIVYLLSGIIMFNFFGESIGLGLSSIVDNAHLINKVYMPKIIYPLSRVLSSLINLVISLVPLVIVMIVTGVPLTKSMFLIPIGFMCLLVFCLGLSLLLSSSMVFFRDTMFLWNVLSTLWMYLTPTFYPVDIIPEKWLAIYQLNPMYQYITFLRSILLDGMAPSPELYVGSIVSAVLMFAVGYWVFKKNQNKFVLYL